MGCSCGYLKTNDRSRSNSINTYARSTKNDAKSYKASLCCCLLLRARQRVFLFKDFEHGPMWAAAIYEYRRAVAQRIDPSSAQ
jgi:hypothetical protein